MPNLRGLGIVELVARTAEVRVIVPGSPTAPGQVIIICPAWEGLPLRWKATARRPIPEAWQTIGPRSSLRERYHVKNTYASHPLNAMLNYGYAVLQSHLQIQAVSAGYDPTLGIMHRSHGGSPAYILDLMEPHRPQVDTAILRFAFGQTFSGADFTLRSDGVVRLGPQLARTISHRHILLPAA